MGRHCIQPLIDDPVISPGELVLTVIGSGRAARRLGLHRTTIERWVHPKTKGGTNGRVPVVYHADIIAMAKRIGAPLTAEELFVGRVR